MKAASVFRSLVRTIRRSLRRRPRVIMTLLCRDEEDIVGHNIAYHLAQGIDFVIATDNASSDRTPQLLAHFAKLGKLHLIHEPRNNFDQGEWVTRMARMAARRFGADWVINNDADEFWLSDAGTVREALAAVPRDVQCLSVQRSDMAPPKQPGRAFYESMLLRLTDRQSVHWSRVSPKACHRAHPDIRISVGNHHVERHGTALPESGDHSLQILHFPLRSAKQLERKIRAGTEALMTNKRFGESIGVHWRRLYQDYLMTGRLKEYYDERAPTAAQVEAGLAGGRFAMETRIRDVLRKVDPALTDCRTVD